MQGSQKYFTSKNKIEYKMQKLKKIKFQYAGNAMKPAYDGFKESFSHVFMEDIYIKHNIMVQLSHQWGTLS